MPVKIAFLIHNPATFNALETLIRAAVSDKRVPASQSCLNRGKLTRILQQDLTTCLTVRRGKFLPCGMKKNSFGNEWLNFGTFLQNLPANAGLGATGNMSSAKKGLAHDTGFVRFHSFDPLQIFLFVIY
jgi:hypothetical protein